MSGCEEDIEKATGERATTVKFKEKKHSQAGSMLSLCFCVYSSWPICLYPNGYRSAGPSRFLSQVGGVTV
jgi:hypothetical protein